MSTLGCCVPKRLGGLHDGSGQGRAVVGCMLTVLDEVPSDEERHQSLDNCIDLPSALRSV
jgi:hypothetical protein